MNNFPWLNKWDILENIKIEKLIFGWQWFAKLEHSNPEHNWKTILITGWAIPWSIVNLRVLRKKKRFIETQIVEIIQKSPIEKIHKNNPYGESGGWKWINIPYENQLEIKQSQVKEAFFVIEKNFWKQDFLEIEASPIEDWYRNKVEFSFGKYLSNAEWIEEHFNVWFHKQWQFSKVIDYDWTPLIDEKQNQIYREIKKFCKTLGLPVYDQKKQEWFFRHILLRKAYFTDEMMILLSFNPEYFDKNTKLDKAEKLNILKEFFIKLAEKYSKIKSIYFSHNPNKADVAIWDLELIYGKNSIKEKILWLEFEISPTSFFQTNSAWAEKLYSIVLDFAKNKSWVVLDLYWWTGTIWMIFAKSGAKKAVSVELVTSASKDWEKNAKLNNLKNISFENTKVEDFLEKYLETWEKADLLIIDPPRAWMHPKALEDILKFEASQMIYVSCNPATLARDLEFILKNSPYKIEKIKAMDMFPHTHHIETVVSLIK